MKKIACVFTIFLFCLSLKAQNAGVEKSIYNIQTGFLGIWINNEYRLLNEFSLRSEIGFDGLINGCSSCDTKYGLTPVLILEPRWYYNIAKRNLRNRGVNNSANFTAVTFRYNPDWFVISNVDNARIYDQISIIPKWGLRRNIGSSNFNYEAGIGIGVRFYLNENLSETAADLHLRIGYTFK